MTVRYTRRAVHELGAIFDHLRDESPAGAETVQRRLRDVIALIGRHPMLGRQMRTHGVRRVVVSPYPYLVFYRAAPGGVVILSVRHAARQPHPRLS